MAAGDIMVWETTGVVSSMVVKTRQPRGTWRFGWLLHGSGDDKEGMA